MQPQSSHHRHVRSTLLAALAGGVAILTSTAAQAYVGPGAGLSAIGSLVALVLAVLVAIIGFLWYPLKRLMKGKKTASDVVIEDDAPAAKDTSAR